jgi:hypothetical protein
MILIKRKISFIKKIGRSKGLAGKKQQRLLKKKRKENMKMEPRWEGEGERWH